MIGDPLEIFRDEPDLHRPIDRMRVFDHEADSLTENLAVEIVHLLVVFTNFERQVRILADECVQTLPDHPLGDSSHARDIDVRLQLRFEVQLQGALADVDRHIAHPLEVRGDLETCCDKPEILPSRLV